MASTVVPSFYGWTKDNLKGQRFELVADKVYLAQGARLHSRHPGHEPIHDRAGRHPLPDAAFLFNMASGETASGYHPTKFADVDAAYWGVHAIPICHHSGVNNVLALDS